MTIFEGVFPAVLTPFQKKDGRIDVSAFRTGLDVLIQAGVHGLFVAGTTGEGVSLSVEERCRLIDAIADCAKSRVRTIIHASFNDPHDAIAVALYAQQSGMDGIALLPPWYYACDAEGIFRHILKIAEAVPGFPVFLYNIPARTGNAFTFEIVQRLKDALPHLAGIKESGSLENVLQWLELQDERFVVFNGLDTVEYESYRSGTRALVASFANIMAASFVAFHQAATAGDWEESLRIQDRIREVVAIVDSPNQIANLKAILVHKGYAMGTVRPPLRELTDEEVNHLLRSVRDLV